MAEAGADDTKTAGEMSDGLQVELFHPDSDREVGDTNIVKWGFDVHPVVFPVAGLVIALFIAVTLLFPSQAETAFGAIQSWITGTFGWFYILSVNVFIIAVLYFGLSKYGKIRIGGVQAEQEFDNLSWMAMLFSAGMGIGLMFFSVAEPIFYTGTVPPFFGGVEAGTPAAAGAALVQTFFHWGIHPWAIYALVALGLAFFSFNRGLPLTFRSIFWPLLGDRIYGWPGHVIDILSVFATLFGLATSLGLGVSQVNAGLSFVAGDLLGVAAIPEAGWVQVLLIAGITAIATMSVAAGLDGGVKRLSTINLYLMLIFLGFMLLVGPTFYIFNGLVSSVGEYLISLPAIGFYTGFGGGQEAADFMGGWTLFYWAWWISWSPFVGMFIARISKGRTIREFVTGVLILPSLFSFLWLSTFGGSAIFADYTMNAGVLEAYLNQSEAIAMFAMLSNYPLTLVSSIVGIILVVSFFVTSSDSGSLVIDHLTSGGKHDVPKAQRIFWAITEGAVAAVLLVGGGLTALQTGSLVAGLPFAVILLLMCYTVYLGLDHEHEILESEAFADRLEELSQQGELEIDTSDDDVVTNIRDDSATSDD